MINGKVFKTRDLLKYNLYLIFVYWEKINNKDIKKKKKQISFPVETMSRSLYN